MAGSVRLWERGGRDAADRWADGAARAGERSDPRRGATPDWLAGEPFERARTPKRDARHCLAVAIARANGWRPGTPPPIVDRCVVVAAPHTYFWDGFWMVCFAWWWNWDVSWLIKESMMRGLSGTFLAHIGAIPVDRSAPHGLVDQLTAEFERRQRLYLVIPPEGTRRRQDTWKSGFYHIARAANVPVCLSYINYAKKEAGFGPCFYLSGNVRADMDRFRDFYRDAVPRFPERFTPPKLAMEPDSQFCSLVGVVCSVRSWVSHEPSSVESVRLPIIALLRAFRMRIGLPSEALSWAPAPPESLFDISWRVGPSSESSRIPS